MLPVLMYALWLVVCYKANDINSVVWAYAVEIIAVSVAMIGFFYNAGYVFGQPKPVAQSVLLNDRRDALRDVHRG